MSIREYAAYNPEKSDEMGMAKKLDMGSDRQPWELQKKLDSELSDEEFLEAVVDIVNQAIEEAQKHGVAFYL